MDCEKLSVNLWHRDCLEAMKNMPDNCVDSIVTDPPYGLKFMGKKWDYDVPSVEVWKECLRVLKPGGFLLSFASTRTQHRMCCRIEDAGFEIRDMLAWVYGSGFPKSLDVSKAIDKAAGVDFDAIPASGVGFMNADGTGGYNTTKNQLIRSGESTEAARQWNGWGTALKPALEPITMARKPLSEKTVAENVLKWGTGCINIDGCRIVIEKEDDIYAKNPHTDGTIGANGIYGSGVATRYEIKQGRFPANLIHDGSEEVAGMFPDTNPSRKGKPRKAGVSNGIPLLNSKEVQVNCEYDDSGSASRFFYCAKANKKDRNAGLDIKIEEIAEQDEDDSFYDEKVEIEKMNAGKIFVNNHPTVKPTDLMRYLCRLVTPIGGIVLDPYMGSGTTGKAAVLEGFKFVGIEKEESSFLIAEKRIQHEVEKWN